MIDISFSFKNKTVSSILTEIRLTSVATLRHSSNDLFEEKFRNETTEFRHRVEDVLYSNIWLLKEVIRMSLWEVLCRR
jgi:hypothetical protein